MAGPYNVTVSPEALVDIVRIATWWRENRTAAPRMFQDELEDALVLIAEYPEIGARARSKRVGNARVVQLVRSRYRVFYQVVPVGRVQLGRGLGSDGSGTARTGYSSGRLARAGWYGSDGSGERHAGEQDKPRATPKPAKSRRCVPRTGRFLSDGRDTGTGQSFGRSTASGSRTSGLARLA